MLRLALFLCVGLLLTGCKENIEEIDPLKAQIEVLTSGTWEPTTLGITLQNTPRDEWQNFNIRFQ